MINDRVDVALAMNADGVHLGQSDMSVETARKLLPRGSIIGVSCNTVEHVKQAIHDKVDYIGIGSVWSTQTKKLTSPVIGVRGIGALLEVLDGTNIKAVAIGESRNEFDLAGCSLVALLIGGIKTTNLLRTLHGAMSSTSHALDGIAVVSEIVASPQPNLAAEKLQSITSQFRKSISRRSPGLGSRNLTPENILGDVTKLLGKIRSSNPLIHQVCRITIIWPYSYFHPANLNKITNVVVATQSANVTLAVGASPIMATEPREMEDLTRISGALLINIGSVKTKNLDGMVLAGMVMHSTK